MEITTRHRKTSASSKSISDYSVLSASQSPSINSWNCQLCRARRIMTWVSKGLWPHPLIMIKPWWNYKGTSVIKRRAGTIERKDSFLIRWRWGKLVESGGRLQVKSEILKHEMEAQISSIRRNCRRDSARAARRGRADAPNPSSSTKTTFKNYTQITENCKMKITEKA